MEILKQHNCRYCSKIFASTKSRWNHETLTHKNEKNYIHETVNNN